MKTILRIAKFELSTLFYSPIAWLVLVAFMVHTALSYTDAMDIIVRFNKIGYDLGNGITYSILSHPNWGMFKGVMDNAFFFIPLLTMGLISKEIANGSIKLVMSSPVTAKQLVLGKYIAILAYVGIMVVILLFFMIATGISIESADIGLMFSGVFAYFLLSATYASIGLFISSLTSYQVVAAIGTLALLFGLSYMGRLGQGIPFVEDLTYWLSMSGRANGMINGLIATKDVIYFVIIIILFLSFTINKISSGRVVKSILTKSISYLTLFGIAFLAAYVSSRPTLVGYFDTTRTNFNTLNSESKKIVSKIEGPIKMTSYVNMLDDGIFTALPKWRKRDMARFDKYKRFLPQLEFEYIYYYDTIKGRSYSLQNNPGKSIHEIAKKQFDANEIDESIVLRPDQIKEVIDLSSEDNQFIKIVEHNGKKATVRMFDDQVRYPSENETSATIKQLIDGGAKTVFVTGHGERSYEGGADKHYQQALTAKTYRESMIQKGFLFESVNLQSKNIPSNTDVLVIADPTTSYSNQEVEKIKTYITNGGNALILAEPSNKENISALIKFFGVHFKEGSLIQENEGFDSGFILADFTKESSNISDATIEYKDKLRKVSMPSAAILEVNGATNGYTINHYLEVKEADTKIEKNAIITGVNGAVALTVTKMNKGKEQRVFIASDADFLNNVENLRDVNGRTKNKDIVGHIFGWLTNGEYPVSTKTKPTIDNNFTIGDTGREIAKYILVGLVPLLILLFGLRTLMKRRKH